MKGTKVLAILGGVALLAAEAASTNAVAGELRVRCERRSTRSRISVDGRNVLPGNYSVTVSSGKSVPVTKLNAQAAIDQFEADFDSNLADIRAGATKISRTFIQNGKVSVNVTGPEALSATDVSCVVR